MRAQANIGDVSILVGNFDDPLNELFHALVEDALPGQKVRMHVHFHLEQIMEAAKANKVALFLPVLNNIAFGSRVKSERIGKALELIRHFKEHLQTPVIALTGLLSDMQQTADLKPAGAGLPPNFDPLAMRVLVGFRGLGCW